jgi:hypothetical protein
MRSHEVTTGRTIVAIFDHGDDLFTALDATCRTHGHPPGLHPDVHRRLRLRRGGANALVRQPPFVIMAGVRG